MARPHILFDGTELVLLQMIKNKVAIVNLQHSNISRIQFDTIKEFSFFRRVPSESIRIFTNISHVPYRYTRKTEKTFWEEYKKKLTQFAKDNNTISFSDNTTGTEKKSST